MATASITPVGFNRDETITHLEKYGWAVVPKVLSEERCNKCIEQYKTFIKQFDGKKLTLENKKSLIQTYRIGHFEPSWEVRLKAKDIFAQLWGTDKLLTSADGVAISKPPDKNSGYAKPDEDWLHLDQGGHRTGLHAYQGGVYLEETSETDHCFRVLDKSHLYHSDFYKSFPRAFDNSRKQEFYKLNRKEKEWFSNQGCTLTKISVPKGGLLLWDSRTVHDNVKPEFKRPNKNRWRFVVFVSMTPAIWASEEDFQKKQEAYTNMLMTTHWSSQGINTFDRYDSDSVVNKTVKTITELPDIAKSKDARLLFGIDQYDYKDGSPNGPEGPTWISG